MAYQGYLIKLGTTVMPNKFIEYNSYIINPKQRIDMDSYRDASGVLRREVLEHMPSKIEWNTPSITNIDLKNIITIIENNYIDVAERKINVTYYNILTDSYDNGEFYMPDIQATIERIEEDKNIIYYNSIRLALIEY